MANGPWGNSSIDYDGVGNRINLDTTLGGNTSTRLQKYAPNLNQQYNVYTNGARPPYNYDGAGNIIADIRSGEWLDYTYNKRNRLSAVTRNSVAWATYGYNAIEQLTTRVSTAPAAPVGQIAYTYDNDNHLLTEANAATGAKTRDYIWLPSNDNSPVDLPLAVIDIVGTTHTLTHVHADHLGRPTRMTSAAKATVWSAAYKPWGEIQSLSGTVTKIHQI